MKGPIAQAGEHREQAASGKLARIISFPRWLFVASPFPDPASSMSVDPDRVMHLFEAPERIADSAFLRREVASRMHERLELVKIAPDRVLDAGCGEGADLATLQQAYPGALTIGM